jgi:hypothetical protein
MREIERRERLRKIINSLEFSLEMPFIQAILTSEIENEENVILISPYANNNTTVFFINMIKNTRGR